MSRAKDLRDAIDQEKAERHKCATCTQHSAMENDIYCFYCRDYWDSYADNYADEIEAGANDVFSGDPE